MERQGLKFTLVSGDDNHNLAIKSELSKLPVKTHFYRFQDCETILAYLKINHDAPYHIVMLDMDDPEHVGMACLKAIRKVADYKNIIIISYSREEDEAIAKKILVEGGNIYFTYPKTNNEFHHLLKKLIIINWKIYTTGADRQTFMLKL